jgi:hypothetical protein
LDIFRILLRIMIWLRLSKGRWRRWEIDSKNRSKGTKRGRGRGRRGRSR